MRDVEATLATFTTDLVVRLCERTTEPNAPPIIESVGTLLQVDIAGSSVLAEKILAKSQRNAADEFAILLNNCFDCIISTIQSFGGEVVDFAGDSVLAIWEHGDSRDVACRSIVAASMAALKLNQLLATVRPDNFEKLAVRSAISAGPVMIAGIGGLDGDRRLFLTGSAIGDLAPAASKGEAGTIVVSAGAWELACGALKGRRLEAELYVLDSVTNSKTHEWEKPQQKAGISNLKGAQSYVPKNVRALSEDALVDFGAELRTTTMVFCRIKAQQFSDRAELQSINDAIRSVQEQCNRYHGLLETVRADDKGTTFMVAFGLPPTSLLHRRSAALGFAHHVSDILHSFGYEPGIGIATGRVFQGPIGVAHRRQFAFVGSPTILGCRLMQLSTSEIVCDEATKALAEAERAQWGFQDRGPQKLKGFAQPVSVYSVIRRARGRGQSESLHANIVGRSAELKLLQEQMAKVISARRSLTLIEGEAGVGKSVLVREALWRSELTGCKVALGSADLLVQSTPYTPWRQILTDLFDLPENYADQELQFEFRKHIAGAELDMELLPLLNDVFGVGIQETEQTRRLLGSARARKTQQFLADVIDAYARKSPIILVLEDVHWIDVPSWDLCTLLYEKSRHIGMILTQRPANGLDRKLARLMSAKGARRIVLNNLDRDAVAELVQTHMIAGSVPRAFLDTLYGATEGNPFFVEQVVKSWCRQDQRSALVKPSKPTLDLMQLSIPTTLEMAILQRVDELAPKEQLLLKSASAIGDSFKLVALMHAHSLKEPEPNTRRYLQALIEAGFVVKRGSHQSTTYAICHQLMRKVIYDLIPRSQLAPIHGRIARWYETGREGPQANYFAQLAHHWLLAGAENKSLIYLSRAGERSLKSGAHTEAGHFFQSALDLASKSNVGRNWRGGDFRLARWEAQLAQSFWSAGALDTALVHACRALGLIGFRVPSSRIGWLLLAVRQLSTLPLPVRTGFGWNRIIRRRRRVLESGAVAAIVIAQVAYYTSDTIRMLAGSLLSLRLATPGVTDSSVGRSYAYLGYMAGVMRLDRVAARLFRLAKTRSTAEEDVVGLAYAHGGEALYHLGFGRWSLAAPAIGASLTVCRSIGDPQLTEIALTLKALLHYFSGNFFQSEQDFAEIFASAKKRLSNHHSAWGAYGRAENLLPLGKARQACRLIEVAKKLLQGQTDLHSELICHGLDAVAQFRLGKFSNARVAALSAIDLARKVVPNNFSSLEGYAAPIETLLTLRAMEGTGDRNVHETRYLTQAFRSLTNYAHLFPIGRPRLWYLRGLRSHFDGDRERTTKRWLRSLNYASNLGMGYEEYRACEALHLFGCLAPAELSRVIARENELSLECGYQPSWTGMSKKQQVN